MTDYYLAVTVGEKKKVKKSTLDIAFCLSQSRLLTPQRQSRRFGHIFCTFRIFRIRKSVSPAGCVIILPYRRSNGHPFRASIVTENRRRKKRKNIEPDGKPNDPRRYLFANAFLGPTSKNTST